MLEKTKEKYEKGKELYLNKEYSLTKISKLLNLNRGRLSNYLKENNIEVINRQNFSEINTNIFEVVDTEEKAYWLGFLYADGYVSNKTNHIELALALKDEKHIKKFCLFINYQGTINKNEERVRISFQNKKMKNDLIKLGCTPNKSLTIKFPQENVIPNKLIKHFVRGYMDGDGYIGWHQNGFGRLGICSGSKIFLQELVNVMNWKQNKITQDKRSNTYSIEWAGYPVYNMLSDLYENAQIYLDRKHLKYIEIKNAVLG